MTGAEAFWRVRTPTKWPAPPELLSFSALRVVEDCPRRWALEHAMYSGIGWGYPEKPGLAALAGRAAHASLDRIVSEIGQRECRSPSDVVAVLRDLGGISEVVEATITRIVAGLAHNPRATDRVPELESALRRQVPALRQIVQLALSRASAGGVLVKPAEKLNEQTPGSGVRGPLVAGFHTEVQLVATELGWVGWADAIVLTATTCEILDYKTGHPAPQHAEQLQIYALLWARDEVLNPARRPATRLGLVYPGGVEDVPAPSARELLELESQLVVRSGAARDAVGRGEPFANLGPACAYCAVRHLCEPYWAAEGQRVIRQPREPDVRSLQVLIAGRRADGVYDALVERDPYVASGTSLVVVSDRPIPHGVGSVRLLDVRVSADAPTGGLTVTLTPASEVYEL